MRSRGEEDIPLTAITIDFFDGYRFYLKKEGYAPATINRHLCWLSRLMYRAVSQGTIRFNPFEEGKYEAVERKPRFLSKGDVAKLLAFADLIYPQGKTENGSGESDTSASDCGADTLALHEREKQRRLQDIPRYDERRKATHPSQSRGLGVWHSYSAGLPRWSPQLRHADLGGWHSDREHRQDDGAFVHCQRANLCPNY